MTKNRGERAGAAELAERIEKCGISLGYGKAELARILERIGAKLLTVRKGNVIVREGEKATRIGFVLSGALHLMAHDLDGTRHLMQIIGAGQFLGGSLLFRKDASYPADVIAFEDSEVVVIEVSLLRSWQREDPAASRFFEHLSCQVSEALVASWQKATIMSCPNIAERVLLYLAFRSRDEKTKTIVVPGTEADFASYLGVHPTALSRVLSKLRAENRLAYRRNVLTLP